MPTPPPFPIKGNKLQAFARKKTDNPLKKMVGADDDTGDDNDKKDSGPNVDLDKAVEDAAAHNDEDVEIAMDGYDPEVDGNPPDFAADQEKWGEAKKAVQPKWNTYDDPYAVLAYVYKQLGGSFKKQEE